MGPNFVANGSDLFNWTSFAGPEAANLLFSGREHKGIRLHSPLSVELGRPSGGRHQTAGGKYRGPR
jgi:hypothetical protein